MVDYDAAVAAVQDPNADPVFLAKIAYENPEFGANVAVNPRAYPGLIRWLAEFGDDRARQTVAQLGYEVPDSPAGAHQPGESNASVEPAQAAEAVRTAVRTDEPAQSVQQAQPVQQSVQQAQPQPAQPVQSGEPAQPVQFQPVQSANQSVAQSTAQPEPSLQPIQPVATRATDQPAALFDPQPQPASYGADAYVQPAANPYGFTATQAATTTDQMQMAEIARSAPELYADLARNPDLYPALVDWLAQLHDPAVDAALASRVARY